jgi:hypothetical protein
MIQIVVGDRRSKLFFFYQWLRGQICISQRNHGHDGDIRVLELDLVRFKCAGSQSRKIGLSLGKHCAKIKSYTSWVPYIAVDWVSKRGRSEDYVLASKIDFNCKREFSGYCVDVLIERFQRTVKGFVLKLDVVRDGEDGLCCAVDNCWKAFNCVLLGVLTSQGGRNRTFAMLRC